MRKEIKELMAGKSLNFMSKVVENLNVKASTEFEILKMKVARDIIKEDSDVEDLDEDWRKDRDNLKNRINTLRTKQRNNSISDSERSELTKATAKYNEYVDAGDRLASKQKKKIKEEKLEGDQHEIDQDDDGDIDAKDFAALRKKKNVSESEDNLNEGIDGNTLKKGEVKAQGNYISARNMSGDRKDWEWHSEYETAKIDKSKWFSDKKKAAQEFARGK